jgi:hypothetical protein
MAERCLISCEEDPKGASHLANGSATINTKLFVVIAIVTALDFLDPVAMATVPLDRLPQPRLQIDFWFPA